MRAWIGFLLTFALVACWLGAGASTSPLGIGYLDYPVTAQDEAVYSHAAIAMVESGEWSTPTFLGRFFLYKPPLIYWLSGASAKLFGVSALALRLPSILAAAFTAGLVFVWVAGAASWWRAAIAVCLLIASPLYVELGRRNMTDAIVMASITGAAWAVARSRLSAVAVCIVVGVLCKSLAGLIPLLIMGISWLASTKRPPLKRVIAVAALGLLIAAPWFLYQWETHRRWFEAEFIGVELLAYGASAPPQTTAESALEFYARRLGMGSLMLCVLVLLSAPALVKAVLSKTRSAGSVALVAAIAVMTAAILSYQYRNATYLLPLLPLLAIAAATYAPAWGFAAIALVGLVSGRIEQPGRDASMLQMAEGYCEMRRGNELIVIGIDDDFSISTLPLAGLRYAIQGALRGEGQVTLDFRRMGVILSIAEFNDLAGARARYAPKLLAWGLPNDTALGGVIGWERGDELAELVKANPERDFLFGKGEPPSAGTHRSVVGSGATLLLSHHALPRANAPRRACRL